MKGLLRCFLSRTRRFFKVSLEKKAIRSSKRYDEVTQERTNGIWHYEPSNIISTLELRFGDEDLAKRWARVREYTNEISDGDGKDSLRMARDMASLANGFI